MKCRMEGLGIFGVVGKVRVTVQTRAMGWHPIMVSINTTVPQCAFEAAGRGAETMLEMMRREMEQ